ncbi:O-antigen ligase family protein [Dechloromonas sp. XY25]|uniref:O-antigen ligase family protein n=1 Tax=Dechloromonas hankyongensis TaxID=2908002 RepID=A0ABS9JYJ5_9RHOO|nr:O-antigen ligase family protein [Dechloromonas hankyongensis]MCG2575984.1 O-antigen ligase family protein [Dechloromonas hankyongensis]
MAFLFWLVLLFIQPFEKFIAVKYLLMFGLVLLAVPLGMRPEIRYRMAQRNTVLGFALAIVVWSFIVSLIGAYVMDSLHALSRDLLLQVELLLVGCVLVRNSAQARVALWAIVAGFAVFSLLSSIEVGSYLMDHSLSEGEIPRSHRSFWGGYAIMAGFCLPLVIAFAVSCVSNIWQRAMLFVLVALAVGLTVLYGSRSPLLVVAISVILFFALSRAWKALSIALLVISIGAGWFATQSNLGYLEKYRSLAQSDTYVTNQGLSMRFDVWSGVVEVIAARPLLGYGYGWKKLAWAINEGGYAERWKANDPGKAAYYLGEETHASYGKVNPHNYFLQVAFEIGIPGLLLVLAFWLAVFWQGLKGLGRGPVEHQRLRVVILTTLLAYLLSNVANGFWVGGLANMACALVGILVGLSLTEQSADAGES